MCSNVSNLKTYTTHFALGEHEKRKLRQRKPVFIYLPFFLAKNWGGRAMAIRKLRWVERPYFMIIICQNMIRVLVKVVVISHFAL